MLLAAPLTFAQDDQKPSPTGTPKSAEAKAPAMNDDMRRAIAWELAKERAAARQARIESRRSKADRDASEQNANRTVDDRDPGRKVKDTEAPGAKRDK